MNQRNQSMPNAGATDAQSSWNQPTTEGSSGQQGMSGVVSDAKETITETAHETLDTAKQAAQEITEQTQEQVEDVVAQTVQQTTQAVSQVKEQATTAYETQRDRAVEMLTALAEALKETGQHLTDTSGNGNQTDGAAMSLAPYLNEAADRITHSVDFLRDKDMSGLLHEAQSLAKKQPVLFLGTMFGIGIAGARIFKGMSDDSTGGSGQSRSNRDGGQATPSSTGGAEMTGSWGSEGMNNGVRGAERFATSGSGMADSYGLGPDVEQSTFSGSSSSTRSPEQRS